MQCKKENIDPEVLPNLITDASNYWCVPENLSYNLINGVAEGVAQWFRIQMEICDNSTENNNPCYPADDIYKEFKVINKHYVISDSLLMAMTL